MSDTSFRGPHQLYLLIYLIALNFIFRKLGHMFLNYQNFSLYEHLRWITICWKIENLCIQTGVFLGICWSKSGNFGFREIYWGDLKILRSNVWIFDFLTLQSFFEPNFHRKNLSPATKINLENFTKSNFNQTPI